MNEASKNPLFSIIIASYNHEDFINEAIQSALDQTISNLEIIVVDDGSTDNTVKNAQSITDHRLKIIPISQNRAIHTRNHAIKLARGKYIAFLNSDDVWESNKLEEQLKDFSTEHPIVASFTRTKMITEDGKESNKTWAQGAFESKNQSAAEWLRFFFEHGNDLCISSAVIPRTILVDTGSFNESLIQISDLDLWVKILTIGEIVVNEKLLTKMRIIKKTNLSAPNPQSQRRVEVELLTVLENYKYMDLSKSFFDIIPDPTMTRTLQLASLSRHAWKKSPAHIFFGSKLFGELIESAKNREEIVNHFGTDIIHEFLKVRSEIEVINHA